MDARYEFIRAVMNGSLFHGGPTASWWGWAGLFGALALLKCLATACTVGSGGAGGVLGPSLAIGGIVGALLARSASALSRRLSRALAASPDSGGDGLLAAGMRVPLAAIVMTAEMTGSYGLIVPNMLVCVAAYLIGRRWGLPHEQVPSSIDSPVHAADVVVRLLESTQVGNLVNGQGGLVVSPETHLQQLVQRLEPGQQPAFMVVQDEHLVGTITLPDLAHVLSDSQLDRVVSPTTS